MFAMSNIKNLFSDEEVLEGCFPVDDYVLPSFPTLDTKVISIDLETCETDFERGPGWARGKGYIVGFSVATGTYSNYFPIRHRIGKNIEPAKALAWLKRYMEDDRIAKVGANLTYDIGWLSEEGITVKGELYDVQYAEALLSEDAHVSLEVLSQKYLGEGKDELQYARRLFGTSARSHIWECPAHVVAPYAIKDAELPLRIVAKQFPLLRAKGLLEIFQLENRLIPLLIAMRRAGVTVNVEAAEILREDIITEMHRLRSSLPKGLNINASRDIRMLFDSNSLTYSMTDKGNPSFDKLFLSSVDNDQVRTILKMRELDKIKSTFLEGYILESNINGKIYCQFNQLRADAGGTRSGRFSSSNPNLQNIPVRSEIGKKIRKLFIPDTGHHCWEKNDYSQIEYRFLTHFAVGDGSDLVRAQYNNDPSTDYHVFTQQLVYNKTGLQIERKPIKNINFGLLYGMGKEKLTRTLGVTPEKATEIFNAYHQGAPYVKATMAEASDHANTWGYVKTILGRRSYFDRWCSQDDPAESLTKDDAYEKYGNRIKRVATHKAINRVLQGSAADLLKHAMLACWKAGVFDVIGVPRLTVHDELDFSVIDDSKQSQEGFKEMKQILQESLPLRVPVRVDTGRGANWGTID